MFMCVLRECVCVCACVCVRLRVCARVRESEREKVINVDGYQEMKGEKYHGWFNNNSTRKRGKLKISESHRTLKYVCRCFMSISAQLVGLLQHFL